MISLPVAGHADDYAAANLAAGMAQAYDSSSGPTYMGTTALVDATHLVVYPHGQTQLMGNGDYGLFSFAAGDEIQVKFRYRKA
jgi:hypothetical protein